MTDKGDPYVVRRIGGFGCLLGLLATPPIAGRWFALEPLYPADPGPLWAFSVAVIGLSLWLLLGCSPRRGRLAALSIPFFALMATELVVRLAVIRTEAPRRRMIQLADRCYHDHTAFVPHPFLQFVGRAGVSREDDGVDRGGGFNERGFLGPLLPYEKPDDVVRIACLGGSTTARGYPFVMERDLAERLGPPWRPQVQNFGVVRYSSTHSVVNFVLNVVDYSPDYVVFHHAWNDHWARDRDVPIRGDGTHFMKAFEYPRVPDALLIRASVIYRYLKDRFLPTPSWTFLSHALMTETPLRKGPRYRDLSELWPYERNVRTIVDLALLRGIVPVLTTQPHATDPDVPKIEIGKHIDQCNAIVRRLASEYGDRALFVDLDAAITSRHEEFFIDLGHMNAEGTAFKARAVADAILRHWREHHPG